MDTALAVLPWILPPLLGAIIGYVTNRIAIKMLFRPLTAKRIFGIRVPLTPGVIPRNRFDLARTIGRMVSEQLLSPEALREQLEQAEFRSSIARWIGERRRTLMQQPISRPAVKEGNGTSDDRDEQESPFLDELMQQLLAAFLQSPQCARMVQSLAVVTGSRGDVSVYGGAPRQPTQEVARRVPIAALLQVLAYQGLHRHRQHVYCQAGEP